MSDIRDFVPLWGEWELDSKLGEGSFGSVWKVRREGVGGRVYYAAVKHISIPKDQSEIKRLIDEGIFQDEVSAVHYYDHMLQSLADEIDAMYKLRGYTNIVAYEDHRIIPKKDNVGYDLLLRMELLTPLTDRIQQGMHVRDVVALGKDIATAIDVLSSHHMIHRDIKPQNIFVNDQDVYKLGDYGTARTLGTGATAMSRKGTYNYMSPEIYNNQKADIRADIYSLGLVLYRLLNGNRLPFLPTEEKITSEDSDHAMIQRISGEPLSPPRYADDALAGIVLKACAFRPEDRYGSAKDLIHDLENYQSRDNNRIKTNSESKRNDSHEFPFGRSEGGGKKTDKGNRQSENQSEGRLLNPAEDEATIDDFQNASKRRRTTELKNEPENASITKKPETSGKKRWLIPLLAVLLIGIIAGVLYLTGVMNSSIPMPSPTITPMPTEPPTPTPTESPTPTPTPIPVPVESTTKIDLSQFTKVWNIVTFGTYPQTAEGTDKTPIEWIVLDVQDGKSLLLSKYGLDVKPYNTKNSNVTWEQCTLRNWLNHDFLNTAFNADEQSLIMMTDVDNSASQGYSGWDTNGGNNTQDKLFLLSYTEANRYFGVTHDNKNNTESRTARTAYSVTQGAYARSDYLTTDGSVAGWWWLRSPGSYQNSAAYVSSDGSLYLDYVYYARTCVRPAFWLNLESTGLSTVEATPTLKPLNILDVSPDNGNETRIVWEGGIGQVNILAMHYFNENHNEGITNYCKIDGWADTDMNGSGTVRGLVPGQRYWIKLFDSTGRSSWYDYTEPMGGEPDINVSINSINFSLYKNNGFHSTSGVTAAKIEKTCRNNSQYDENQSDIMIAAHLRIGKIDSPREINFSWALILPNGDVGDSCFDYPEYVQKGGGWIQNTGISWENIYNSYGCIPRGKYTYFFGIGRYYVGYKTFTLR